MFVAKRKGALRFAPHHESVPARLQHHGLSSEACAMTTLASELNAIGEESISESGFSSIGVVVGASAAEEAAALRQLLPSAWSFWFLGWAHKAAPLLKRLRVERPNSYGSLVVCSRSLLFPQDRSDYDQKAKAVRRFVRSAITETARTLHQ